MYRDEYELRAFLRLCIDPGTGRDKRTPVRMLDALPGPALTALDRLAPPHLRAFRKTAADLADSTARMRYAYATAALAWIREEEATDELHDLVMAASTHGRDCRRCVGGTLAAGCEEAARIAAALLGPADTAPADQAQHCDSHPTETADEVAACAHQAWEVTSEYRDALTDEWVKVRRCADCPERLEDIREPAPPAEQQTDTTAATLGHATAEETAAYVAAGPAGEELPCAHESWDVTSEYSEGQRWKTWVQSRRCNDCREPLEPIRSTVPHFEEHQTETVTAAALGHATVEETAAAYVAAPPEAEQQGDDWPAALRTPDGRVWTRATAPETAPETAGADLYESPTSPTRYTPAALLALYGQLATTSPARSTADTGPLKDYARVCRDNHLIPFTTALVHSGYSNAGDTLRAAVHISLEPGLELDTTAVDQIRAEVADGLTTRE